MIFCLLCQGYRGSRVLQGSNVVYIYGGGFIIFESGARNREQKTITLEIRRKCPIPKIYSYDAAGSEVQRPDMNVLQVPDVYRLRE